MNDAKESAYYNCRREELLGLVPLDARNILDCGCGTGRLGSQVKMRQECKVVGVEIDAVAASQADKVLDTVIAADIEDRGFEQSLPDTAYDCVIMADILEHLRDPWGTVRKIADRIKPGGVLIVSVPNVAHFSVIGPLVTRQRWHYDDSGILDRGHLRFFTLPEITALIENAGFDVESVAHNDYQAAVLSPRTRMLVRLLRLLPGKKRDHFTAVQWLITSRRAGGK